MQVVPFPLHSGDARHSKSDDPDDGNDIHEEISNEVETVSTQIGKAADMITHALTTSPVYDPYTYKSLGFNILGILLYLFDYVSDIVVAYLLKEETGNSTVYFRTWTIVLIVVPLLIVNLFSLVWYHQDHIEHPGGFCPRKEKRAGRERLLLILSHVLCLGPVVRQFEVIWWGRQEQRHTSQHGHEHVAGPYCVNKNQKSSGQYLEFYMTRKYYERDSAYLALIDSFIQDAPQLILQLYILLARHPDDLVNVQTALAQLGSVLLSLLSLSLSLVSYAQASRWADPNVPQLTPLAALVQWLWRLFMLSGRMFVFCMFLTVYLNAFFVFLGFHYLVMLLWILFMRSNFCGSIDGVRRPVSELVYNVVMAFVLVFDIVNIKDGPTRLKNCLYYSLVTVEHGVLMYFWYKQASSKLAGLNTSTHLPWSHSPQYHIASLVTVPALEVFLVIYYNKLHPTGNMPDKMQRAMIL